jgi:hypothetical protein
MRLGEIRNIAQAATDDTNKLQIEYESLYGGQAYLVSNYSELLQVIDIIAEQPWNDVDVTSVSELRTEYDESSESVEISSEEFNILNSYITAVNEKYPTFFLTVRSFVDDQDEQVINVKLPDRKRSLADLNELNSKLEKLFKEFKIDGDIQLIGFDKGTDWYVILFSGTGTFSAFIACLKVAQEIFKTRTEYYKSEKARLDYLASLKAGDKSSGAGLTAYRKRRMNLELEQLVSEATQLISDLNGRTQKELEVRLVKATQDLVEELGEDVEFHLSLNPPEYAQEHKGSLSIDYKKIRQINKQNDDKTKQIAPPKED